MYILEIIPSVKKKKKKKHPPKHLVLSPYILKKNFEECDIAVTDTEVLS